MPELSTGLVIAGAYADKVRRTLFAQLKDSIKAGTLSAQDVARGAAELNRLLFEILVNKLGLDKGDVVRVRIAYDVQGSSIVWHLNTLRVEAFRRIPDEDVEAKVREALEAQKAPGEAAEAPAETSAAEAPSPSSLVASAELLGRTVDGGLLYTLKSGSGENVGLALVEDRAGAAVVDAVIVPGEGSPLRVYSKTDEPLEAFEDRPELVVEAVRTGRPAELDKETAQNLLKERMSKLSS